MAERNKKHVVAIADDFLTAFSRIPRKQQGKVIQFINKFRSDPGSAGINYEKITRAKDSNLRSVRIDGTYRGIALAPEKGNVYVLLWVDHHDKAYTWARNKVCNIHPETGSLQVVTLDMQTGTGHEAYRADEDGCSAGVGRASIGAGGERKVERSLPPLFHLFTDQNLTALGVPEMLLPVVREIRSEEDLDRLASEFPGEAAEALYMLAAGFTLEEVYKEMDKEAAPERADIENFAAALENPDSKRRFFVVEDERELLEILHEPLEKWRVFLHPSQRKLVENSWNGPVRVLGGAGTGKTVVAIHRARRLAEMVFTAPDDRILFTTFTRNLAADIHDNLKKICSERDMQRIEVVNLDRWVANFLKRKGYDHKIVYPHQVTRLWERALSLKEQDKSFDDGFYREEWDRVIQPQSITTLAEFKKASRVGRGVRLNRKAREKVWPVFEEYRILLNDAGLRESVDAMRDCRHILEGSGERSPYKAVVVDEAQDMGMQAFKLIRALLEPDDDNPCLFIVGDAHQRIYKQKVVLSHCGINIRGRARKLRINYRTTDENRLWAVGLLKGISFDDLDGGTDDLKGYRSLLHGSYPRVISNETFERDVDAVEAYLREGIREHGGEPDPETLAATCLVTRTTELLEQYESALSAKGIPTYRVKRTRPDDRSVPGLRLATMHRVKGIEFDTVIVAGVNQGVVPLEHRGAGTATADPVVRKENEIHERSLLYVAATRAKKEALITSFGQESPFLQKVTGI